VKQSNSLVPTPVRHTDNWHIKTTSMLFQCVDASPTLCNLREFTTTEIEDTQNPRRASAVW